MNKYLQTCRNSYQYPEAWHAYVNTNDSATGYHVLTLLLLIMMMIANCLSGIQDFSA